MIYDNAMISKIKKSKMYSTERERIIFDAFDVRFTGDNNGHAINYIDGKWTCDCNFFKNRSICGHTMAMERILGSMIEMCAS